MHIRAVLATAACLALMGCATQVGDRSGTAATGQAIYKKSFATPRSTTPQARKGPAWPAQAYRAPSVRPLAARPGYSGPTAPLGTMPPPPPPPSMGNFADSVLPPPAASVALRPGTYAAPAAPALRRPAAPRYEAVRYPAPGYRAPVPPVRPSATPPVVAQRPIAAPSRTTIRSSSLFKDSGALKRGAPARSFLSPSSRTRTPADCKT